MYPEIVMSYVVIEISDSGRNYFVVVKKYMYMKQIIYQQALPT